MNQSKLLTRVKPTMTRLGSLILLFQRLPVIQMLFPEANMLGGAALSNSVSLAVTTVVGLGAYDSVAGATTVAQISPVSGSTTVPLAVGSSANITFQLTGLKPSEGNPKSWTLSPNPAGLNDPTIPLTFFANVTGTPTTPGTTSVKVRAWAKAGGSGDSYSKTLTFCVLGFTTHPGSTSVNSGSTTTLTCAATGAPGGVTPTYQWFQGEAGVTTTPVGSGPSFTTPALSSTTNYWVRITNAANPTGANSSTATVTVGSPFENWAKALPAGQNGPLQTPENDGVSNLMKFAFNMDPTMADLRQLRFGVGDSVGLPAMALVNGRLRIEYIRRMPSTNPGITYTPMYSSDGVAWETTFTPVSETPIDYTDWERVVVDGPAGQIKCLGRVKVTLVP